MSNIKADLARRIAANVKIVEMEPEEPPEVEDQLSLEVELRKELQHLYERLNVSENKRLRKGGRLRDSSVELGDPLSPPVDHSMLRRSDSGDAGSDGDDNDGDDGNDNGQSD